MFSFSFFWLEVIVGTLSALLLFCFIKIGLRLLFLVEAKLYFTISSKQKKKKNVFVNDLPIIISFTELSHRNRKFRWTMSLEKLLQANKTLVAFIDNCKAFPTPGPNQIHVSLKAKRQNIFRFNNIVFIQNRSASYKIMFKMYQSTRLRPLWRIDFKNFKGTVFSHIPDSFLSFLIFNGNVAWPFK